METNIKIVGFANQSINGVSIGNEGFDMEYDGQKLNLSGFSGDKLYYAKLDNRQIVDLLNIPSSGIPLERRILFYKKPKKQSIKTKKIKLTQRKKIKKSLSSKYVTPKMRSEYRKNARQHKPYRSSIKNTIY